LNLFGGVGVGGLRHGSVEQQAQGKDNKEASHYSIPFQDWYTRIELINVRLLAGLSHERPQGFNPFFKGDMGVWGCG
jgi:hypothetical protein